MPMPVTPSIYHILHVDRLPSVIADGFLWCDAEIVQRTPPGTTIGMNSIKQRRLRSLSLASHPDLYVGDCVPFYFCPRSIMLYLIHQANHPELDYRGGQSPIIHLEANLHEVVEWADAHNQRWAFTLSNAGSYYFSDRCDLRHLSEIDWGAVSARDWRLCKEGKQAEFLIEHAFPWELVSRVGVHSRPAYNEVRAALRGLCHKPNVEIRRDWYY